MSPEVTLTAAQINTLLHVAGLLLGITALAVVALFWNERNVSEGGKR